VTLSPGKASSSSGARPDAALGTLATKTPPHLAKSSPADVCELGRPGNCPWKSRWPSATPRAKDDLGVPIVDRLTGNMSSGQAKVKS
jgi:hypothetical protein